MLYGSRSTHRTYGHKTNGAHRVSHALNEPRGLHEPAPHRILQGPDEPPKSAHYRSGSTIRPPVALLRLRPRDHKWPSFGIWRPLNERAGPLYGLLGALKGPQVDCMSLKESQRGLTVKRVPILWALRAPEALWAPLTPDKLRAYKSLAWHHGPSRSLSAPFDGIQYGLGRHNEAII